MKTYFPVERLVPRFLLNDKNGYAMAKAMERAMEMVAEGAERGLAILKDPEEMPEWRLDEMAWELNCLYELSADIETKRAWIRNAVPLYRYLGTPYIIYRHIAGYFAYTKLEEWWEYGGEPYHFRVAITDRNFYIIDKHEQAIKAINRTKNVRSVLDGIYVNIPKGEAKTYVGTALYNAMKIKMRMADVDFVALQADCICDETGAMLMDENGYVLTE